MALGKVHELGLFIRDQRRNARLSLRKVSQMAGISNPYLSQIERGLRRPSAEILQQIAKALRLSAETLYVKAGILEERTDDVDVVTALLRDQSLSERQRRALIEIYQSFRHENEEETTPVRARTQRAAPARPKQQRATRTKSTASRAKKPTTQKRKTTTTGRTRKRAGA